MKRSGTAPPLFPITYDPLPSHVVILPDSSALLGFAFSIAEINLPQQKNRALKPYKHKLLQWLLCDKRAMVSGNSDDSERAASVSLWIVEVIILQQGIAYPFRITES